jgi:hypothetical protein
MWSGAAESSFRQVGAPGVRDGEKRVELPIQNAMRPIGNAMQSMKRVELPIQNAMRPLGNAIRPMKRVALPIPDAMRGVERVELPIASFDAASVSRGKPV